MTAKRAFIVATGVSGIRSWLPRSGDLDLGKVDLASPDPVQERLKAEPRAGHAQNPPGAELDSLVRTKPHRTKSDPALFLASDSTTGLAAAVSCALGCTDFDSTQVTYRPTPEERCEIGRDSLVTVARLEGIKPDDPRLFRDSLGSIALHVARWLEALSDWRGDCDIELVWLLTGGYKATIPALVTVAEFSQLVPGIANVRAEVLWEGNNETFEFDLRKAERLDIWSEDRGFGSSRSSYPSLVSSLTQAIQELVPRRDRASGVESL